MAKPPPAKVKKRAGDKMAERNKREKDKGEVPRIIDQDKPEKTQKPPGKPSLPAANTGRAPLPPAPLPSTARIVPWAKAHPKSVCYAYHSLATRHNLHKGYRHLQKSGEAYWDEQRGSCVVRYQGEFRHPSTGKWMRVDSIEISLALETARAKLQKLDPATREDIPALAGCRKFENANACLIQEKQCVKHVTRKSCVAWKGNISNPDCKKWKPYTACAKKDWVCVERGASLNCDKLAAKKPGKRCVKFETRRSCQKYGGSISSPRCLKRKFYTVCAKWERICDERSSSGNCAKKTRKEQPPVTKKKKTVKKIDKKTAPSSSGSGPCKGVRGTSRPGLDPGKMQAWLRCNRI